MVATDPSVDTMTTVPVTIDDLLQKYKVGPTERRSGKRERTSHQSQAIYARYTTYRSNRQQNYCR
jgi:hypothetical protein